MSSSIIIVLRSLMRNYIFMPFLIFQCILRSLMIHVLLSYSMFVLIDPFIFLSCLSIPVQLVYAILQDMVIFWLHLFMWCITACFGLRIFPTDPFSSMNHLIRTWSCCNSYLVSIMLRFALQESLLVQSFEEISNCFPVDIGFSLLLLCLYLRSSMLWQLTGFYLRQRTSFFSPQTLISLIQLRCDISLALYHLVGLVLSREIFSLVYITWCVM